MNACVVCGVKGAWAGAKQGSHKICLVCHRRGYKFGKEKPLSAKYNVCEVISPSGRVVARIRVKK